ncbi:hypothetical protein ABHN09_10745 [Bacillus paramobilis]|uniref:hypothetical protein n=1 Tax=Bacillus paramobilis TaxID=2817477 RepID=UPI003D1D4586
MENPTCVYCGGYGRRHNGYFEYPCNQCNGQKEVVLNHKLTLPGINDSIKFPVGGRDILVLKSNGDIYVNGRLVENDKEVVDGLREFLKLNKTNEHNERK